MKKLFCSVLISLFTCETYAALAFDNITSSDFDKINKELFANFSFTSIASSSSLGKIFGFEVGLLGGSTATPEIEKLVKAYDPAATSVDKLYHAGLLGRVSVPFGITVEALMLPSLTVSGASVNYYGLGVAYSLTESVLPGLPVGLGFRAHHSRFGLKFDQTINNSSTGNIPIASQIEAKDTTTGLMFLVSANLLLVEPYIGIGTISGTGDVSVSGTGSIFDQSFTTGQSASSSITSSQMVVGAELKLLIFKLGLEYASMFDTSRYSAKMSFYF